MQDRQCTWWSSERRKSCDRTLVTLTRLCSQSSSEKRAILEPPWLPDAGGVSTVIRPLSSSPTKKLVAQSTKTAFADMGLARGAFFSDCGCLSLSAWIQTKHTHA